MQQRPGSEDHADRAAAICHGLRAIEVADASAFAPGVNVGKRKVLTDSCYLVVHPRGTLVWDTGMPDALADKPEGLTRGVFTFKRDKTLAS